MPHPSGQNHTDFWERAGLVGAALAHVFVPSIVVGALTYVFEHDLETALLTGAAVMAAAFIWYRYRTFRKATDLIAYAAANKSSQYMPSKILERKNIIGLSVMGNGCSKWTRGVENNKSLNAFRSIRQDGGNIRFLASSPIHLKEEADKLKRKNPSYSKTLSAKAAKNAASLLMLREFANATRTDPGTFEIRLYRHIATMRVIIVEDSECIVGHYQENGLGESYNTPLLVFRCNERNSWGFGHAFVRLFESEWHRAIVPSESDWETIKLIGRQRV